MHIELAEVSNNSDVYNLGMFYVRTGTRTYDLKVYYVSPYFNGSNGGFIAIPEIGSRVLICQPDESTEWFYLGTTTFPGRGNALASNPASELPLPDPRIYRATGAPQRYVFKSPLGNSLILSDEHNDEYFNIKTELRAPSGKTIKLIDSPQVDSIIIENEHGDRIKISSTGNNATAPRSIDIETKGPISITTRESSLDLTVIDGKELNITNKSTGSKRANANDPTPGNINILTSNGDVNVTSEADDSSIFLEAKGGNSHIVLKSAGAVDISGDKGVNIISSGGNVSVRGTQIHLN